LLFYDIFSKKIAPSGGNTKGEYNVISPHPYSLSKGEKE